jgi:hypothetical protein
VKAQSRRAHARLLRCDGGTKMNFLHVAPSQAPSTHNTSPYRIPGSSCHDFAPEYVTTLTRTTSTCSSHQQLHASRCLNSTSCGQSAINIDHKRNQNPPNSYSGITGKQSTPTRQYIDDIKRCCSYSLLRKERC